MSKSNPVHPWRLGRTRALIFTQKSLNRARTGVPHGTPKKFPRLGQDVSTMRKTQSTKINRKINSILYSFGHTRALRKKKVTRNSHFSRPAETDPYDHPGCHQCLFEDFKLKSEYMHLYPFMPVLWVPSVLVSHVWEPNGELGSFFKTQITSTSLYKQSG